MVQAAPADRKQQAEEKKRQGNEEYKNKNYDKAIALYEEAIRIDPDEIVYHSNIAAAQIELKDYDKAIAECNRAIEKSKGLAEYDFILLSKCMARKAQALQNKDDLDNAILTYRLALLEQEKHKKKIAGDY